MFPGIPLGVVEISSWRVVVLTGIVLCWFLLLRRTKRLGFPAGPVLAFLVLELLVGTVGGHLFNWLIPILMRTPGSAFDGLTVIGTTVATLSFAAVYLPRVLKTDPLAFMDGAAFTYPLGLLIGRFGCMLNGCCFGTFASEAVRGTPLRALTIPAGLYAPLSQAGEALKGVPPDRLLWNLPLMLMFNALCVLAVTEALYRRRERWGLLPGTVVAAALSQETLGRFLMEFLRRDELVGGTAINPWQLSLVFLFAVFFGGLCLLLAARGLSMRGSA